LVDEATDKNFPVLLKRYSVAFEEMKMFESVLPRHIKTEDDLKKFTKCLHHSVNNNDLLSIEKVKIIRYF
jgi:hypothetical protein